MKRAFPIEVSVYLVVDDSNLLRVEVVLNRMPLSESELSVSENMAVTVRISSGAVEADTNKRD